MCCSREVSFRGSRRERIGVKWCGYRRYYSGRHPLPRTQPPHKFPLTPGFSPVWPGVCLTTAGIAHVFPRSLDLYISQESVKSEVLTVISIFQDEYDEMEDRYLRSVNKRDVYFSSSAIFQPLLSSALLSDAIMTMITPIAQDRLRILPHDVHKLSPPLPDYR